MYKVKLTNAFQYTLVANKPLFDSTYMRYLEYSNSQSQKVPGRYQWQDCVRGIGEGEMGESVFNGDRASV